MMVVEWAGSHPGKPDSMTDITEGDGVTTWISDDIQTIAWDKEMGESP